MAAGKLLSRTGHVAPPAWFSWGSKISAPEKRLGRGFKTPSRVGQVRMVSGHLSRYVRSFEDKKKT